MQNRPYPKSTTIYRFITEDFRAAWDALAASQAATSRGNFLFARQGMALVEWACRLSAKDPQGQSQIKLTNALHAREARYFARLPGRVPLPQGFALPATSPKPDYELLAAIWDLVRNGQAHQYCQIVADLTDGWRFGVSLTGADAGRYLDSALATGRPADHLQRSVDSASRMYWLKVRTDVLFLDIEHACRVAGIHQATWDPTFLRRKYPFSSGELLAALPPDRISASRESPQSASGGTYGQL